jgi:hypothetical protein
VVKLPDHISPDAQCAAYLTWALPALALLTYGTLIAPNAARRAAIGLSPSVPATF